MNAPLLGRLLAGFGHGRLCLCSCPVTGQSKCHIVQNARQARRVMKQVQPVGSVPHCPVTGQPEWHIPELRVRYGVSDCPVTGQSICHILRNARQARRVMKQAQPVGSVPRCPVTGQHGSGVNP